MQLVLDTDHGDVQAWGNLLNLAVLLFFMAVLGQYGPTYNPTRLSIVWRLQYGLGRIGSAASTQYVRPLGRE